MRRMALALGAFGSLFFAPAQAVDWNGPGYYVYTCSKDCVIADGPYRTDAECRKNLKERQEDMEATREFLSGEKADYSGMYKCDYFPKDPAETGRMEYN